MSKQNKEGCIGIILRIFGVEGPAPAPTFPYALRDAFLSPAEISFFHVLKGVLGPEHHLIAKVRLADLFFVWKQRTNQAAFNRIGMKHVDFVVCDAKTMQPLLAVELDDASHRTEKTKQRDAFVDKVFAAAKLPLMRVPAARGYVTAELREMVTAALDPDSIQAKPASPPLP